MSHLKLVTAEPEPRWMGGLVEADHGFALLEAIIETTPECIKLIAADGSLLYMNHAGLSAAGVDDLEAIRGGNALGALAPECRAPWLAYHNRVIAGERLSFEYDIVRPSGERRHMETRGAPLRLADGRVVELGLTRDVTERVQAQKAQRRLIDELNHRVKNTLATVQSIAMQTLKQSATLEEFGRCFENRLISLAKAHDVLTRTQWRGAGLCDLLKMELAPYPDQTALDGPDVELPAPASLALSVVIHELATNAVKYGALSVPEGRVEIAWRRSPPGEGPGRLDLEWAERGGPPVRPPEKQGFGMRVIRRIVERDLEGRSDLDFAPGGLCCRLSVPIGRSAASP
jgi:PAS domain S-box-containing protein